MVGVDLIASQLHDKRVRRAAERLHGLSDQTLDSLAQLARLNADRAATVFRTVAVSYITLPIALGAFLSDAAPAATQAYVAQNLDSIWPAVFALVVTPIIYFMGLWRAKQIAWAIDLHRAGAVAPLPGKNKR